MRIGIPKEIKILEARVALIPAACAELVRHGHEVQVQSTAGVSAGYADKDYLAAGCQISRDAQQTYQDAELLIKVKEPQPQEVALLGPGQILFSFLHLAAEPELMAQLQGSGSTAVGFETIQENHALPVLAPMSDIAGRISVQIGSNLLQHHHQGRGVLLGGLAGTERGNVVILGAGVAGGNATKMAQGMGANVTVFDLNVDKLEAMRTIGRNVTALYAYEHAIEEHVRDADIVIGAVLIPGAKSPKLVSKQLIKTMNPGSVVMDISVDQGGCIETIRPTDYARPTYLVDQVVHFGVTNLPGAVPRTASQALSASLLPYILRLARPDWQDDPVLAQAVNIAAGEVVYPALKTA